MHTLLLCPQVQLQGHMDQYFEQAKTVKWAIEFTQRFERYQ